MAKVKIKIKKFSQSSERGIGLNIENLFKPLEKKFEREANNKWARFHPEFNSYSDKEKKEALEDLKVFITQKKYDYHSFIKKYEVAKSLNKMWLEVFYHSRKKENRNVYGRTPDGMTLGDIGRINGENKDNFNFMGEDFENVNITYKNYKDSYATDKNLYKTGHFIQVNSKSNARPFLGIVLALYFPTIERDVLLKFKGKKLDKRFLDALGKACVEKVHWWFRTRGNGSWKANAPSTIARKGSNDPMIETGTLYNSIDYKIHGG